MEIHIAVLDVSFNSVPVIRLHRMHKMQSFCRFLLLMIAMSVRQSVSLSRDLTRLHCAKMTERIKMLFEGPWNIALHGVLIPHREKEGSLEKFCHLDRLRLET